MCVLVKSRAHLKKWFKDTPVHLEEIKSHQTTFAHKKTTKRNKQQTLFPPEAEGMTTVIRKKK